MGDVLNILQCRNRGKQSILVLTPYLKQIGTILQNIVDDLTFKKDYGPDELDDYEDEDFFYILSGYAVVKNISKGRTYRCDVDFYYKRT